MNWKSQHDCQTEAFTTVGIGDMGGDVFGNGMLMSKVTKLLAFESEVATKVLKAL